MRENFSPTKFFEPVMLVGTTNRFSVGTKTAPKPPAEPDRFRTATGVGTWAPSEFAPYRLAELNAIAFRASGEVKIIFNAEATDGTVKPGAECFQDDEGIITTNATMKSITFEAAGKGAITLWLMAR